MVNDEIMYILLYNILHHHVNSVTLGRPGAILNMFS